MDGRNIPRSRSGRETRSTRRSNRLRQGNNNGSTVRDQEVATAPREDLNAVLDMNLGAAELILGATDSASGAANAENGTEARNLQEDSMLDAPTVVAAGSTSSSTTAGMSNRNTRAGATTTAELDSYTFPRYPVYNSNRIYSSPTVQATTPTSSMLRNDSIPSRPRSLRPATTQPRAVVNLGPTSAGPLPGTRGVEGYLGYNEIAMNPPPLASMAPPGIGLFQVPGPDMARPLPRPEHYNSHEEFSSLHVPQPINDMQNNIYLGRQQQLASFRDEQRAREQAIRNLDRAVAESTPHFDFVGDAISQPGMDYAQRLTNYSRLMERSLTDDGAGYVTRSSGAARFQDAGNWSFFPAAEDAAVGPSAYETIDMPGGGLFAYGPGDLPIPRAISDGSEQMMAGLVRRRRAYEEKYREALAIKLELQTLRISLDPISNDLPEKAECAAQALAALEQCQAQAASWRTQAERIDRDIEEMRRAGTGPPSTNTTTVGSSLVRGETRGLEGENEEGLAPLDYLPMEIVDRGEDIMQQETWRTSNGTVRRARAHGVSSYAPPGAGAREGGSGAGSQARGRAALPRRNPRNQDGN